MPSCAQRLTVFGDTWRSSATCAVRRYLGSVVWSNALSRSCCRPPGLGRPYACWGRMPSSVLHRLAILGCVPTQLGFPAGTCMDVDRSVASLELRAPSTPVAPAQVTGLPGHRLAARQAGRPVVTSSGRSRYCAPGRGSVLPRNPQVELVALRRRQHRAGVGRYLQDGGGGQEHDGWNREMVQRREGLRLHRP